MVIRPANKIVVASCADNNYAIPLCASLKSILLSLSPHWEVDFFILVGDISLKNKQKISLSLGARGKGLQWIQAPVDKFRNFPQRGHLKRISYSRLFLPTLLKNHDKILWIDGDTVVLNDLSKLWRVDLEGSAVGAAQDSFIPTFREGLPEIHKKLGVCGELPYFNAGVMVMNLKKLREMSFEDKVFQFVKRHHLDIQWVDQDCLNALLISSWKKIDARWNQIESILFPDTNVPYSGSEAELLQNAYVLHYAGGLKPWSYGSRASTKNVFFKILDQTLWEQWRPAMPWKVKIKRNFKFLFALYHVVRKILR